jgi:hypothetical protein
MPTRVLVLGRWVVAHGPANVPPATVQLGNNCRAILLNRRLRPDATLESVTLETLSQEVIVGLMGASLMNPQRHENGAGVANA